MKFGHWLGLLALVAAAVVLWTLRQNLILFFAAVVLAMALCTVVDWVRQKLRCARPLAFALSFLLVLVVLFARGGILGLIDGWVARFKGKST